MSAFSNDIAVDLGTTNTLVYVVDRGIIIDEPSVVAVSARRGTREVWAVGAAAVQIIGRTPESLELVKPLQDGVIADFLAVEEILRQFIRRARTMRGLRRPSVLVSVPAGATPVERRAVADAVQEAGARKVLLIAEPVAAALGAGLPVDEAPASMVVDIGGGTADLAVLSRGSIVEARSSRCAGHAMDAAIVRHVRRAHGLAITTENAEQIKIEAGSASTTARQKADTTIRGRDVRGGRLKSVVLTGKDIATALEAPIDDLAEFLARALEDLPPKVSAEIETRGICLTGGGALLDNLGEELGRRLRIGFFVPRDPLRTVIKGSALVLEQLEDWEHLLIRV